MPDDTRAALEWIEYRSSLCSGCLQDKTESMDAVNDGGYEAIPITCFGCAAKDAEERRATEAKSGGQYSPSAFDGVYLAVQRREGE